MKIKIESEWKISFIGIEIKNLTSRKMFQSPKIRKNNIRMHRKFELANQTIEM